MKATKFDWKSHIDFVYSVPALIFPPLIYIFDIKMQYIVLIAAVKSDFESELYVLPSPNNPYGFAYKGCSFGKK